MRPLFAPALLLLLSACQATGTGDSGALNAPVDLPPDYRAKAAPHLAAEYARDAIGPAEITSEVQSGQGLLGASSSVLVRYPVRTHSLGQQLIAKDWLLDSMEKTETGMRCISVSVGRGIQTGGETKFVASRPKVDGTSCGEGRSFVPYTELEQVAQRLKACQAKGEERCLLATSMPAAQARKLMNQGQSRQ
jgi:hypothetical protein